MTNDITRQAVKTVNFYLESADGNWERAWDLFVANIEEYRVELRGVDWPFPFYNYLYSVYDAYESMKPAGVPAREWPRTHSSSSSTKPG